MINAISNYFKKIKYSIIFKEEYAKFLETKKFSTKGYR